MHAGVENQQINETKREATLFGLEASTVDQYQHKYLAVKFLSERPILFASYLHNAKDIQMHIITVLRSIHILSTV